MIGRRKHPRDEHILVYMALRRGEHQNRWVPLEGRGFREDLMDAALVCADDAADRMLDIAHRARRLRALSEHPEIAFAGESVDADMLRAEIRELEALIRAESENMDRLLEPPDRDSVILDGHVRLRGGAGGVLEPMPDEPEPAASGLARAAEAGQSADERFGMLLDAMVSVAEQSLGEALSQETIDDAIARLRDLNIPDEPYEPEPTDEEGTP
jgi:hypothetical protein